jgi:hypothetical protein
MNSKHKQHHKVCKIVNNRTSFFVTKQNEKIKCVPNDGKSAKIGDGNCGVTEWTRDKEDGEGGR